MPTPSVSESVRTANTALRSSLPFDDISDFEDAQRGFVGRLDPCIVKAADGRVVWDNESYRSFLEGPAPDSVNPSLWRQSILNAIDGLFEVVPGIYQVRGLDLSNITFVEGDSGRPRHRPAHQRRDGRGRPGSLPGAPRGPAGRGGHLHAQPRRPLRRRQGRHEPGGRGRRDAAPSSRRTASWSTRSPRTSMPGRP